MSLVSKYCLEKMSLVKATNCNTKYRLIQSEENRGNSRENEDNNAENEPSVRIFLTQFNKHILRIRK